MFLGLVRHTVSMRLLGYTRVSTTSQDARLQIDALIEVGVPERDIFSDVTSGSRNAVTRPKMKKLLEYAVEGDMVVVWRIDRMGRSLMDVLNTVTELRDRGIQVRSISDGIDPATASGRMMLGMLATMAEYERELVTERVTAGIKAAKSQFVVFGRPPVDPALIAQKLEIVRDARAKGRTAKEAAGLVGWSRATLYRHQRQFESQSDYIRECDAP